VTPERFQEVSRLFREACAVPEGERAAFLDDACADAELRSAVDRLLAVDGAAGGGGEPEFETIESDAGMAVSSVPRQIGGYRVKRMLAEGGMGRVYLAVQEHPRRTVALKVMKSGVSSRSALRRFEYESQILARLRHPHIAQVYEAGTHHDGAGSVPYFAMEYVPNARPLTEYAQETGIGTRERLAIFAKVCDALHHGHQKGIIHRDLKPSNILVDASGEPKIIDFGVARATDSDMAITTLQTDIGQLIGTLQYMSPEQCEADPHDIDTRSDVYTLGVVLYELLCERLPYDVSSRAVFEATRVIREEPPPRPSTVDRALRGDIETITLKALEKDRRRRYPSAGHLGEDIQHYLAGEPIAARPASLLYVGRTWVRRHRPATAVAALILALTAMIGLQVRTQMQLAAFRTLQQEAQLIAAVVDEGVAGGALRLSNQYEGELPRIEAIEYAIRFCETRLQDEPALEADLRTVIGRGSLRLGAYPEAETQLRIALARRQVDGGGPSPGHADTLHYLGRALFRSDRFAEAEQRFEQAIAMRRTIFGDESAEVAESIDSLGACARKLGRYDEATNLREEVLAIRERLLAEGVPDMARAIAQTRNNLAFSWLDLGRYAEAEEQFRLALGWAKSTNVGARLVASTTRNVAVCRLELGRYEDALDLLDDALELSLEQLDPEHVDVARNYYLLARVHFERGELERSLALCADALQIQERALRPPHSSLADTEQLRGLVLIARRELDAADAALARSLTMRDELFDEHHPAVAAALAALARLRLAEDDPAAAETLCLRAIDIQADAVPEHARAGAYACLHGKILIAQERWDEAEETLLRSLEILERALPRDHKQITEAQAALDACRLERRRARG
jgi:tetratricopeptide (TPR) repeat protein